MKSEDLLDMIGNADDSIIEEASKNKKPAVSRWTKWAAAAACLCLAACIVIPRLAGVNQDKGGTDSQPYDGPDSVAEIAALEFNGAFYEVTDIPEALERYGLTDAITENEAGGHLSYLEPDGAGYKESAAETDIELMQYAPAPCRAVYIVRDGEKYLAALFCGIMRPDSNANADMETLYQFYEVACAEDIASISEMDWDRNKTIGDAVTDSSETERFYDISKTLTGYGNDDFQAFVFDGIPEEQQPEAHTDFADDLRIIRIETKTGLRFFISVYPVYGWIYADGIQTYYRLDDQMTEWIERNIL